MHALQTSIIEKREAKQISTAFIASKLGVSESVLIEIENTSLFEIDIPRKVLQTYLSRYAQFLDFSKNEIAPALYAIEKHNRKPSKLGKKTWLDYINRIFIFLLFLGLIYNVYALYQQNELQSQTSQELVVHPPKLKSVHPADKSTINSAPSTKITSSSVEIVDNTKHLEAHASEEITSDTKHLKTDISEAKTDDTSIASPEHINDKESSQPSEENLDTKSPDPHHAEIKHISLTNTPSSPEAQ